MTGDTVNAELGAAKVAIAAGRNHSLEDQHEASRAYLGERTIGTVLLFCAIFVGVVWLIETPDLIRYSITGLTGVLAIAWATRALRAKSALHALRDTQANAYQDKA